MLLWLTLLILMILIAASPAVSMAFEHFAHSAPQHSAGESRIESSQEITG